jgi:single stranded DNA-binding protein
MTNQNMKIRGIVDTEPSLKKTKSNETYAIASIRTFESVDAANGQKLRSEPEWHTVKAWGQEDAGELCKKVKKGMFVEVEGPIQTSTYTDAKGVKRNAYAILPDSMENVNEVSRSKPMLNSLSIEGRLGNDPRFGESSAGRQYVTMSVATNDTGANGSKRTQWVNVMTSSPDLVELAQALKKGSDVKIEGMLKTSEYRTRDNAKGQSFTLIPNSIEIIPREKSIESNTPAGQAKATEVAKSMPDLSAPAVGKGLSAKSAPAEKETESPVPL